MAFCAWWVFNVPIYFFLVAYFLMPPLKLGFVMLARVLCESVSTRLICSSGKLSTGEVRINVFFPNKFCHFFTKKLGNFRRMLFFSCASVIFHNQCHYLTNVAIFWEIAIFAISQNWGEPVEPDTQ